jgi:hypothetical protein
VSLIADNRIMLAVTPAKPPTEWSVMGVEAWLCSVDRTGDPLPGSADGAQPAPLSSANSAAPGWLHGPPPQGSWPPDAWPAADSPPADPQSPPPGRPAW